MYSELRYGKIKAYDKTVIENQKKKKKILKSK